MPVYKCPKCGRVVEKAEGTYYCKVCGPRYIMIRVDKPIQRNKIAPTHDWFYIEIDGEYYIAETVHDGLYEPEEWVKEMLALQRMSKKEFLEKYSKRRLTKISKSEAEPVRYYTEEQLRRTIGAVKMTHGVL